MSGRDAPRFELRQAASRAGGRGLAAIAGCTLAVLTATGCGGGRGVEPGTVRGTHLTIYASTPLHGPDRVAATDVVRAERLALAQDGGVVGRFRVRLVSLDAAAPATAGWDPAQVSQNASRAAADPTAVAYLGELDAGSSAISLPLLNEAGIVEVSPLDPALSLTAPDAGVTGSPERYYPNQQKVGRTFARLVPSDHWQALALLRYLADERVHRLALLTDEDATGLGFLNVVRAGARAHGIAIVASDEVDGHARDYGDPIRRLLAMHPDAVAFAGDPQDGALVRLWRQLALAAPALKLFLPGALADARFRAGIGAAGAATYVTRPLLPLAAYPPPARRFARAFVARYGSSPAPEALCGYEAMSVVLAAIRRAAGNGTLRRADVVRAVLSTRRGRGSVLGTYAIDRRGDTSLRRFGAYRVVGGALRFEHALEG